MVIFYLIKATFQLTYNFKIKTSISDPYHLAGSGSTSGNVESDPGSKNKCDKLA